MEPINQSYSLLCVMEELFFTGFFKRLTNFSFLNISINGTSTVVAHFTLLQKKIIPNNSNAAIRNYGKTLAIQGVAQHAPNDYKK